MINNNVAKHSIYLYENESFYDINYILYNAFIFIVLIDAY